MNDLLIPTIQQLSDFGTTEPFVARIALGLPDLSKGLLIDENTKNHIIEHIQETFQEFSHAFISLREIEEMESGKKPLLLIQQQKAYQDVYGYCWTAYKDRMPKITLALGIDVGFMFAKSEKDFKAKSELFKIVHSKIADQLISMIIDDRRAWQNDVCKIRNNYIEHKSIRDENIKKYFTPQVVHLVFDNCWQAIEEILVICFSSKLVPGIKIGKIQEKDIHKSCSKKFCFYVDPTSKLTTRR